VDQHGRDRGVDAAGQARAYFLIQVSNSVRALVRVLAARCVRAFASSWTLLIARGRREDRVHAAPMVRVQQKSTRQNHRYEPNNRPSLRNGFTAYTRSPR
jgi:hypothetical protein